MGVTGFPEFYTPGTPYSITIARNSGNSIRNFNGSCRLGTGTGNAGTLIGGQGTSTYSVTGESNGIHLSSNGQNSATFTWTAPQEGAGEARLYIGAYQGSGTNGQTSALTLISHEGGGPDLTIMAVTLIHDDDDDGLAESGENVELSITLLNGGSSRLHNVTGTLMSESPSVQLTQPVSDWPDIWQGQSAQNDTPFALVVDPGLAQDQTAILALHISADEGVFDLEGDLLLHWAPPVPLEVVAETPLVLTDGDGDGVAEPGEAFSLSITLVNHGTQTLTDIQAVLSSQSMWLEMSGNLGAFPALAPQASASVLTPFTLAVLGEAPPLFDADMVLQITCDQGDGAASFTLPIGVRELIWDTVLEDGVEAWSHSAADGWADEWHLSQEDAFSPTHAWKCGSPLEGTYQSHVDARLLSPVVTLRPWSQLTFRHRMDAEFSSAYPDSAYDGGVVEISRDGGAIWEEMEPVGGYTHQFRFLTGAGQPTTHPFAGGRPCFSGMSDWTEARFDLSDVGEGPAQFRFRFGSDDGGNREGWYLDDLRLVGLGQDTNVNTFQVPGGLDLAPACPNPFNPATTLSWTMPKAGMTRVELFDLGGRRLRVLADGVLPAGSHQRRLDGGDLPSGAYLVRVSVDGEIRTGKILLLK